MDLPWETTPQQVHTDLAAGAPLVILDVRTPDELAICRIAGATHIPMDQIPGELQRIEAMAEDAKVVVICHHGVRSMNVTAWLRQQGVTNCQSMSGGIDMWSLIVDSGVPRY